VQKAYATERERERERSLRPVLRSESSQEVPSTFSAGKRRLVGLSDISPQRSGTFTKQPLLVEVDDDLLWLTRRGTQPCKHLIFSPQVSPHELRLLTYQRATSE
jgi:hypothetical protein